MLINLERDDIAMLLSGLSCDDSEDYCHSNESEQHYQDRQAKRRAVFALLESAWKQYHD